MNKLIDFLNNSPSMYHAVSCLEETLKAAGYTCLSEGENWALSAGGRYYLTRGGSSLIAFRVPDTQPKGFLFTAAHCDRPTFQLKENGELTGKYTRLATEKYGGMIMSTWMDRPLSVAGRVIVETETGVESKLLNIDKDLLLIPSVAIHMNRKVNEGVALNPAVDTLPLAGTEKVKVWQQIEEAAGGKILGHDLYLYLRETARIWGAEDEFISAQGLDDLLCVWGNTQGFLNATDSEDIPVLCVFDSEEVGSCSVQGAASQLLASVTNRICKALGQDADRMLANSFMLSGDNAHAVHPNHPEFADATNAPVLGGGIVLKFNAALRYVTTGLAAAVVRQACKKAAVPVQTYYNRADIAGGSTLGSISLGNVSVPSADIGVPQLAMHSVYETAAVADCLALTRAIAAYYSSTLRVNPDGSLELV